MVIDLDLIHKGVSFLLEQHSEEYSHLHDAAYEIEHLKDVYMATPNCTVVSLKPELEEAILNIAKQLEEQNKPVLMSLAEVQLQPETSYERAPIQQAQFSEGEGFTRKSSRPVVRHGGI